MFYSLATYPEYWKDKMSIFISLAPIAQLKHTTCAFFQYFSWMATPLEKVGDQIGVYEILGEDDAEKTDKFCTYFKDFCILKEAFTLTHDVSYDDVDRFQVYMGHYPGGTSVRSVVHFSQGVLNPGLRQFDYGKDINLERYGQETAPFVNL